MAIARIFKSGNSQAVRLPKEFRFHSDQVEITRRGDEIILREHPANGVTIFETLLTLPNDFMPEGRQDSPPQTREHI